jgi:hypothetical protein
MLWYAKRRDVHGPDDIRNILTETVARRGESGKRSLAVHADNARPNTAK